LVLVVQMEQVQIPALQITPQQSVVVVAEIKELHKLVVLVVAVCATTILAL
jgi:hypothetical protein